MRNGFSVRLRDALRAGLKTSGIRAKVDTEPIRGTRLHRVYVIAKQFAKRRPTERQDLIWRIVDRHFRPDEQLRISMIFTVTPEELPGDEGPGLASPGLRRVRTRPRGPRHAPQKTPAS